MVSQIVRESCTVLDLLSYAPGVGQVLDFTSYRLPRVEVSALRLSFIYDDIKNHDCYDYYLSAI